MNINIYEEANRCLKCKVPMCQKGCPIGTPINKVTEAIVNNHIEEAAMMLFENNPLSVVCSLVCNQENQCEGHCVLGKRGGPISFGAIENYISDAYFDRIKIEKEPDNGKKVAIIGSGPAGLTISIMLAKRGYQVTIFEGQDKIGGVLQFGIPEFRLPKSILERYRLKLIDLGVSIRPHITIGETIKIEDLFNDGYLSVFVGTGVWRPHKLGIPGETFGHVHYAIDYLANPSAFHLGDQVAIIGMGNAAMDVARTALRQGAQHVTLYARRGEATANHDEIDSAKLDGAQFVYFKKPIRITDHAIVMMNMATDESGKIYETGQERCITVDSVIISISQGPRDKLVSTTQGLQSNEKGLLLTNETGNTTHPGIFAAGDVVHGAKTVVAAVNQAKEVAKAMHAYMKTL